MEKFGIILNDPITPLKVRDAIVSCFTQAHCEGSGIASGDEEINRQYCRDLVLRFFEKTGGDFDRPNKESLLKVIDELADFSKNFRDQEIIKKNYQSIKELIDKLS